MSRKKVICNLCGKEFEVEVTVLDSATTEWFCSELCLLEYQYPQMIDTLNGINNHEYQAKERSNSLLSEEVE